MKEKKEKTFWQKVGSFFKGVFNWLVRYPLALVIAVLVIAVAVILMMLGLGDSFNLGGILGTLFGTDKTEGRVEKANKVPEERVDEEGKPIEVGEPDKEGFVQREVQKLEPSKNPLRDKTKIKIKDAEGNEKAIKLPTGVEDKDVDRVLETKPQVYEVEVKKRPDVRVTTEDLEYLE